MYNGKMTKKLNELYNEYYIKFGCYPDEYDDVDYFKDTYNDFVKDIKRCLRKNREIEDL